MAMDCRTSFAMTAVSKKNGPKGPFFWNPSTAFFAALAGVLLVVGGHATLEAAHLAVRGGKTNALGGDRTRGSFAFGFGAEFFGHEWTPVDE
jgi:hypothetical protein